MFSFGEYIRKNHLMDYFFFFSLYFVHFFFFFLSILESFLLFFKGYLVSVPIFPIIY